MAYRSHTAGSSRIFDHLYDPNYITSDYKDVWRANYTSIQNSGVLSIYPIYKSMFSDLARRSRNQYMMTQNPLPFYPFYGGGNENKSSKIPEVLGCERIKFFDQPIKKIENLKTVDEDCCSETTKIEISPQEKRREIGCQTDYRESSAQTKPWQPNAVIPDGESELPEIIYVADLITGDKNPGAAEANIVERARRKRNWEKTLPPLRSVKDWDKRRVALEAFEWEQWVAREDDIHDCQRLRMEIVEKLINQRKNRLDSSYEQKLRNTKNRAQIERDKKVESLKNKYQRSMRKLDLKHKNISKKYKAADIATEHIDKASDLYGPQLRFGTHPRQKHYSTHKSQFEARLEGLERFETKPTNIQRFLKQKDKLWKSKEPSKEVHKGFWSDDFLQKLYSSLTALREKPNIQKSLPECVKLILKKQLSLTSVNQQEKADIDSNFIQNLITQRRKSQTIDLSAEFESTEEIYIPSEINSEQIDEELSIDRTNVLDERARLEGILLAEAQVNEALQQAEGSSMYFLLDFLGKELHRLQDEKKSHALYMLAERERHRREAAEAGRRQVENEQRKINEEIYRNILKSNEDTINLYLENVLIEGIEKISEEESRNKIREIAKRIDEEANKTLNHEINEENLISDLVKDFVLPEVDKRIDRRNKQFEKTKHILAANDAFNEFIEKLPPIERSFGSAEETTEIIVNELIDNAYPSEISFDESPTECQIKAAAEQAVSEILLEVLDALENPLKLQMTKLYDSQEDQLEEIESSVKEF